MGRRKRRCNAQKCCVVLMGVMDVSRVRVVCLIATAMDYALMGMNVYCQR